MYQQQTENVYCSYGPKNLADAGRDRIVGETGVSRDGPGEHPAWGLESERLGKDPTGQLQPGQLGLSEVSGDELREAHALHPIADQVTGDRYADMSSVSR
ncbi:hypothetical protein [Streptomyces aureoversilis]|uniref:Uncharacterized protein n=1 Tax=Streptomyces aureoversilis TaxID=67277 RepID=A0ABV9ZSN1_9ACTN